MLKIIGLAAVATATADPVYLATFDAATGPTWKWQELNDPVMGGASVGTFVIDTANHVGILNGSVNLIPSLKAPGFIKVTTRPELTQKFPDVSKMLDGKMQIRARSTTPYAGWKVGFGAKGIPRTSPYGGGSFKSEFTLTGSDWQIAEIPFTDFSYDWSGYTGQCDTLDPGGQQHFCCTEDHPEVCPTAAFLSTISAVSIWGEGVQGLANIEVEWIGVSM